MISYDFPYRLDTLCSLNELIKHQIMKFPWWHFPFNSFVACGKRVSFFLFQPHDHSWVVQFWLKFGVISDLTSFLSQTKKIYLKNILWLSLIYHTAVTYSLYQAFWRLCLTRIFLPCLASTPWGRVNTIADRDKAICRKVFDYPEDQVVLFLLRIFHIPEFLYPSHSKMYEKERQYNKNSI